MRSLARAFRPLPLALLLPLVAPSASTADERLAGIACRSVHLGYSTAPGQVFVNSVRVEKSAPGTYFCVCGFGKGYLGMQQLANDKRLLIFSVWDPGKQNDPNAVDEDRRVKLLYRDDDVRIGRFGNEGTGGQSFLDFDWKDGETYHFAVSSVVQGERTEYTAWFLAPTTEEPAENSPSKERRTPATWRRLATFSTLAGGRQVDGAYAFVEDFRRNRVSVTIARRASFANAAIRRDGEWQPITEARFTSDSNPAKTIDAGPTDDGRLFLATGGETTNAHVALGERVGIPAPTRLDPALDALDELVP